MACETNVDHHPLISLPTGGGGGILYRLPVYMPHFIHCLYILQAVTFSQRLNMTFPDFHNIHFVWS